MKMSTSFLSVILFFITSAAAFPIYNLPPTAIGSLAGFLFAAEDVASSDTARMGAFGGATVQFGFLSGSASMGLTFSAQVSRAGVLTAAMGVSVAASHATATMTVVRTGTTVGFGATVNYATVAGGTAIGGASCGAGVDYINASGPLTFTNTGPGNTSQTFTISICDDALSEPSETVNLQL